MLRNTPKLLRKLPQQQTT